MVPLYSKRLASMTHWALVLSGCAFLASSTGLAALVKAFPTAEGFGADAVGGRGGRVIEVTTLDDSGEGSLRAAMEASGPRVCVFRVSGTITLKNAIQVRTPSLTVAGQTSPSGIEIKGSGQPEGDWGGLVCQRRPRYHCSPLTRADGRQHEA